MASDDAWRVAQPRDEEGGPGWWRTAAAIELVALLGASAALRSFSVVEVWPWMVPALIGAHLVWSLVSHWRRPPRPARPARWRLYSPGRARGPARRAVVRDGDAGERMVAPLTGRPCLGYEVAIREDHRLDAPTSTWLLLEQAVTVLEVDGQRLDGQATRLVLSRRRINVEEPRVASFLRRRGLIGVGRSLFVCESVLEAGDVVTHQPGERGDTLTRVGRVTPLRPR